MRVFVSVEDEDRLVAVDLRSRRVLRRIPVPDGPHNVAASADGRLVVVTSPPAGQVTLVSARTLRVLTVFGGFASPHDVELSADGRYAYVTDEGGGTLAVLDLAERRTVREVDVGARPHDLALSDTLMWVTHGPGDRDLTVLDILDHPARPRVVARFPAGGPAHDIVHQPDSARVYVTYWDSPVIGAISGGVGHLRYRRSAGRLLHHLSFDYYSGRRLWVSDHATGQILLVSAPDGRTLRRLDGCPGAHHVAPVSASRAVTACHDSGTLALYGLKGKLASIGVGTGPHGVAVARLP